MSKRKAIGIDLGTSKCCVGVMLCGKVKILEKERGNKTTPSYVAFTDTERLIGHDAKDQATLNPANTVFGVKRFMCKELNDSAEINPINAIRVNGETCFQVTYKKEELKLLPQQISAMLLTKMKSLAEDHLKSRVEKAVISVPASFSNAQRQALKDAAAIAGLKVLALINEPTAAAIAYQANRRRNGKESFPQSIDRFAKQVRENIDWLNFEPSVAITECRERQEFLEQKFIEVLEEIRRHKVQVENERVTAAAELVKYWLELPFTLTEGDKTVKELRLMDTLKPLHELIVKWAALNSTLSKEECDDCIATLRSMIGGSQEESNVSSSVSRPVIMGETIDTHNTATQIKSKTISPPSLHPVHMRPQTPPQNPAQNHCNTIDTSFHSATLPPNRSLINATAATPSQASSTFASDLPSPVPPKWHPLQPSPHLTRRQHKKPPSNEHFANHSSSSFATTSPCKTTLTLAHGNYRRQNEEKTT